jgi:hypothetical protein
MVVPKKSAIILLLVIFAIVFCSTVNAEQKNTQAAGINLLVSDRTVPPNEPTYQGKTLNYWLKAIRDRDEELMPLAFDAIRALGADARAAVPELTRVVAAPFAPIRLGIDSDEVVVDKLYDLEVRSDAIDALAFIGEAAAPATIPLIDWAMTVRIMPSGTSSIEEHDQFIDLVTLEAEYRIAVIHAIQQFGNGGISTLARVVKSANPEKRKFAIMALGSEVLPIATDLLRSRNCDDEQLGIAILGDLEPLVARVYLTQLRHMAGCYAN